MKTVGTASNADNHHLESQNRLLWRDKTCPARTWLIELESDLIIIITVLNGWHCCLLVLPKSLAVAITSSVASVLLIKVGFSQCTAVLGTLLWYIQWLLLLLGISMHKLEWYTNMTPEMLKTSFLEWGKTGAIAISSAWTAI